MTASLPVLTFPKQVAAFVKSTYASADVILEYGSGGSTFVAASQPGKRIYSVESDPVWADRMRKIAAHTDLPSLPKIIYFDIGPVQAWARAVDHLQLNDFFGYAQEVWNRSDFSHPDVVLIDGRFRAACFMVVYLNTQRSVRVLIDDYISRPQYHVIERICRPTKFVARMAVFDIRPEDRLEVEPWCLVATFFDAVCSFQVGPAKKRKIYLRKILQSGLKEFMGSRMRSGKVKGFYSRWKPDFFKAAK